MKVMSFDTKDAKNMQGITKLIYFVLLAFVLIITFISSILLVLICSVYFNYSLPLHIYLHLSDNGFLIFLIAGISALLLLITGVFVLLRVFRFNSRHGLAKAFSFLTILVIVCVFINVFFSIKYRVPVYNSSDQPRSILLTNCNLIDGTGTPVKAGCSILIDQGKIKKITYLDSQKVPDSVKVIDLKNAFVLPGFFNCHVHDVANIDNLKAWANAGVTTVRDLGEGTSFPLFAYRDKVNKNPYYSRIIASGTMMTVPGGYPEAVFNSRLSIRINSVSDAISKADRIFNEGADLAKISLESGETFGLSTGSIPVISYDEANAIVSVAKKRGKKVSAHAAIANSKYFEIAVKAGVNDIAHVPISKLTDEMIRAAVKNNIYLIPTFELLCRSNSYTILDNVRRFREAGGKIALGTDFGGYDMLFDSGMPLTEMHYMKGAGMSPMDIIVAATKNSAYVCGRENDLGTIEEGKIADIIVIDGNPLDDINVLGNVKMVIKDGIIIKE